MPAFANALALPSVNPRLCHALEARQYSSNDAGFRVMMFVNFAPNRSSSSAWLAEQFEELNSEMSVASVFRR
jgi:hypothetical protein